MMINAILHACQMIYVQCNRQDHNYAQGCYDPRPPLLLTLCESQKLSDALSLKPDAAGS